MRQREIEKKNVIPSTMRSEVELISSTCQVNVSATISNFRYDSHALYRYDVKETQLMVKKILYLGYRIRDGGARKIHLNLYGMAYKYLSCAILGIVYDRLAKTRFHSALSSATYFEAAWIASIELGQLIRHIFSKWINFSYRLRFTVFLSD